VADNECWERKQGRERKMLRGRRRGRSALPEINGQKRLMRLDCQPHRRPKISVGHKAMWKQPRFRIDGEVIQITNWVPGRCITLIVIGTGIAVLPLVRPYLPQDTYVAFEDGNSGMAGWLLGIFACLSAAFWWSTVVIDPKAGEVVIRRRWGLFRSVFRSSLYCFSMVAVREDEDGRVSVYLEGSAGSGGLEINSNKALVWGRDKEETESIARSIAEHLKLDLRIHRELGQPKLYVGVPGRVRE
jgi:hypothetical protein